MKMMTAVRFFSAILAITLATGTGLAQQGNATTTTQPTESKGLRAYLDPAMDGNLKHWQTVAAKVCAVSYRAEGYDLKRPVSLKEEREARPKLSLEKLEDAQSEADNCYAAAMTRDARIDWRVHLVNVDGTSRTTAVVNDAVLNTGMNTATEGVKSVVGGFGNFLRRKVK